MFRFRILLICAALIKPGLSCSSGVGSTILNNPTLSMKFYPPVGWTYPTTNAQVAVSYFPGQSLTLTEAQNMANSALTAAVLEALNSANIQTSNLVITPTYTPPLVSDCWKNSTATPISTVIGVLESGAITKTATIITALAATDCINHNYGAVTYTEFIQQATITIKNLVISDYQMQQIASQIMATLNLNNNAQFTEQISIN